MCSREHNRGPRPPVKSALATFSNSGGLTGAPTAARSARRCTDGTAEELPGLLGRDRPFAIATGEHLLEILELRQVVDHDVGRRRIADQKILVVRLGGIERLE